MNIFYRVLFLLILIHLYSCGILFNKKRDFTVYKDPIIQGGSKVSLKTDGMYISKDGLAAFLLYQNGKVRIQSPFFSPSPQEFWKSPQKVIEEMQSDWKWPPFNSKEWWGDYAIKNNEIIIQEFNHHNEEVYKRWVFEDKGRILNDSTIEIYYNYSYWGKNSFLLDTTCILNFYPTKIKPDSTRAWFLKKKWYKQGLHESRK